MEILKTGNSKLALFGLLLILIIFPVVGVWNTFNAARHRKITLSEMPKIQKLENFAFQRTDGKLLSVDSLRDRLTLLVQFDAQNQAKNNKIVEILSKMDEQFGKLEQTQFYVFADSAIGADRQINARVRDLSNFVFVAQSPTDKGFAFKQAHQFAVVDTSATVRNYYNIEDETSIQKMVRHFPFLIPVKKAAQPKVGKQDEK